MEIQYQIFPEKRLLVQRYCGIFDFDHYVKYVPFVLESAEWDRVDKVFTDLTALSQMVEMADIGRVAKYREMVIKKPYQSIFLVDKPLITAIAHLYQDKLKAKDYSYEYCSTFERAEDLLNLKFPAGGIKEMLQNLSSQY